VKAIIERFRGREGQTDLDRRWTRKVTDVRSGFVFSASERWREDASEHEHYTDSGGKSGGQKEKLAYTVLAASLAYQFGLESDIKAGAMLADQFDAVRQWIRALADGAKTEARKSGSNAGYRLEFQEINHRQLGRNQVPVAAWLDTEGDVLALIGKRREAARFHELATPIALAFPQLQTWLAKRPLRVLEATPTQRELSRLQADEAGLYDDLRHDRIGPAVRLEQERIGFAWVQAALTVVDPDSLRGSSL